MIQYPLPQSCVQGMAFDYIPPPPEPPAEPELPIHVDLETRHILGIFIVCMQANLVGVQDEFDVIYGNKHVSEWKVWLQTLIDRFFAVHYGLTPVHETDPDLLLSYGV